MKKCFLLFILGLFLVTDISAQNKLTEIKQFLESKTDFTAQQVGDILSLVESANRDDLPSEILINRLKEGIARKSAYQTVLEVLTQKINSLKLAKGQISECLNKGIKVENIKYSHQLLAELLERGLSEDDFKLLSKLVLIRNMKLDELVQLCEIIVKHKEEQFPAEYSKEIVSLAITKKMNLRAIKYIGGIVLEELQSKRLSSEEIKDIVVYGLNKHRSITRIKETHGETAGRGKITDEKLRGGKRPEQKGEIQVGPRAWLAVKICPADIFANTLLAGYKWFQSI